MKNYKKYNSGFTLIEIMVTVAIVGIFAAIALPSFSNLIERNRLSTATNELQSNLLFARSEALKRSNSVTMCSSTDQVTCNGTNDYSSGWIIYLDCDNDNIPDETIVGCGPNDKEEIIKVKDGFESLFMTSNGGDSTTFNFTGRPAGLSRFNIGQASQAAQKQIIVNIVGRVKARNLP